MKIETLKISDTILALIQQEGKRKYGVKFFSDDSGYVYMFNGNYDTDKTQLIPPSWITL